MDLTTFGMIVFALVLVLLQPSLAVVSRAAGHSHQTCETINLETCRHLPWNSTRLPNVMGHSNQLVVRDSLDRFASVLASGCSEELAFLLCVLHLPECSAPSTELLPPVLPCRSDCERARESCQDVMEAFGLPWPEQLDCSELRAHRRGDCISPRDHEEEARQGQLIRFVYCVALLISLIHGLKFPTIAWPNFEHMRMDVCIYVLYQA